MDPLKSPKVYPRRDNVYKSKSSLNFDLIRSKIFEERRENKNYGQIWLA